MITRQKMRCRTIAQVAKREGVSRQTVHKWFKQGCPGKENGWYNLKKIHEWVLKFKPGESQSENTLSGVTLALKKADLWEKNRLRAEYERKMVDGEQVEKEWEAFGKHLVATLLRWPAQVGSILGVEAQRRALVIVEELLQYIRENPLGVHK